MLPFLLAGLGGYLIGQSQKEDVPEMAKGGEIKISDLKVGDLLKKKGSNLEVEVLEIGKESQSGYDYALIETPFGNPKKYINLSEFTFSNKEMAKGGISDDVEVSVNFTKEEAQILYVVLDVKFKDEGRKIPQMKRDIQSKVVASFSDEYPEEVELRLSVEQIMLIYIYLEDVHKKEPKFKPKMFKAIKTKLFEAVKRSNKALPKHFAQGGVLEHGLREGDRILVVNDSFAGIVDKDGNRIIVNIEEGTRRESTI